MKWNKKTIAGLIFMLPLILVVVWVGFYEFGVKHIESHIRKASEDLNSKGYAISYDDLAISGTPFRITATFKNASVIEEKNLYHMQAPRLTVSIRPWDYKHIHFKLEDGAQISAPSFLNWDFTELLLDGVSGEVTMSEKGRARGLSFFMRRITPKLAGKASPIEFMMIQCNLSDVRKLLSSSGLLSFQITGLHNFLGVHDLDDPLELDINYTLSGLNTKSPISTLRGWSEAGGTLELKKIHLDWLSMKIRGNGTLTLDSKMRLQGSLHASFIGYDEIMDMWVKAGYLKEKDAQAADFVLNLIAGKTELGKKKIEVPVIIKKGQLKIGPAKLLKIPAIE